MKLYRKLSLSSKVALLVFVLSAAYLLIVGVYVMINIRNNFFDLNVQLLTKDIEHETSRLKELSDETRDTILSYSKLMSIQGIIRASMGNGFDSKDSYTLKQLKERLSLSLALEVNIHKIYNHIQYIDDKGQEIVRVNYVNNVPVIVPESDLKDQSGSDYFKEAMKKQNGEIFVSSSGLNKEGTPPKITEPPTPVINYATPVFDEITGEQKGILVASVLIDKLVKTLQFQPSSKLYIVGSKGFFILHPDKSKQWGGPDDRYSGVTIKSEFDNEIVAKFLQNENGFVNSHTSVFVFRKFNPDIPNKDRLWVIIEEIPKEFVYGPINKVVTTASSLAALMFVVVFAIFIMFLRDLFSPLKKLQEAAALISQGNFDQKVDVTTEDEIGNLASEFNVMSGALKNITSNFEQKVAQRTEQLNEKVEDSEKLNRLMVDREMKMIEMKKKLEDLKKYE